MTDQPEALRLADWLVNNYPLEPEADEVADELRRLHKVEAKHDAVVKLASAASLRMQHDYRCESDHDRFKARCDCGVTQLRSEIAAIDAAKGEV